jgi:hypothetical protein
MIGPLTGVWKGPYLGTITGSEVIGDNRWSYSIQSAARGSTGFFATGDQSTWTNALNLAEATNTTTTVQGDTLDTGESILPIADGEIVLFWVNVEHACFDRPNMWDCGG